MVVITSKPDLPPPLLSVVCAGILTIPLLFESVFFGAYSALFLFSIIVLSRRSPSRARNTTIALSVVMYAVSAVHLALSVATIVVNCNTASGITDTVRIIYVIQFLPVINYILSDFIVLWRAWVLWNHKPLLFVIPLISLVCIIGATIAGTAYGSVGILGVNLTFNPIDGTILNGYIDINVEDMAISRYLGWAILSLIVDTNLWATCLIFIRVWEHRCFLRSLRINQTSKANAEKALAFLVESGAIVLCIWIAYMATSLNNRDPYGTDFLHVVIAQVAGMYPTTTIALVAMRLSPIEVLSRPGADADTPIVFAPSSPNPQPQTAQVVQNSLGDGPITISSDATSA